MHLTWQPGDPVIQLDFPNPLNTSVQIGDVAYFSNPIEHGTTGNPLSGDQWESTTTPHLAHSDIIMIGEIINILKWNGTTSSIICNMPQSLFNQYFSTIKSCVTTTTIIPATTVTTPPSNTCPCGNQVNNPCPEFNTGDTSTLPYPYNRINAFALVIQEGLLGGNENINFKELATLAVPTWSQGGLGSAPCASEQFSGKTESKINKLVTTDGTEFLNMNELIDYLNSNYTAGLSTNSTFVQIEAAMLASNNFAQFAECVGCNTTAFASSGIMIDWRSVSKHEICQCYPEVITTIPASSTTSTVCDDDRSFIMFSKDNKVNLSSVLGYYASVTFKNDSTEKAELFNVGADVFESSK
jgi:hypothetical protein